MDNVIVMQDSLEKTALLKPAPMDAPEEENVIIPSVSAMKDSLVWTAVLENAQATATIRDFVKMENASVFLDSEALPVRIKLVLTLAHIMESAIKMAYASVKEASKDQTVQFLFVLTTALIMENVLTIFVYVSQDSKVVIAVPENVLIYAAKMDSVEMEPAIVIKDS